MYTIYTRMFPADGECVCVCVSVCTLDLSEPDDCLLMQTVFIQQANNRSLSVRVLCVSETRRRKGEEQSAGRLCDRLHARCQNPQWGPLK